MEKIDLTGQRFGKLTVLEQDPNPYIDPAGRRELKWICKCDCGNTTSVTGKALRYGRAKSCGCLKSLAQSSDLVGKRYGKLVVEKEDTERENRSPSGELNRFWFCRCDCGNLISVNQRSLVCGRKSGCGCEKEEKINPRSIDMTGQRFGRLTIIEPVKKERRSTRGQMWKCLCDCGKEVVVHRSELVAKKAQSCGCLSAELASERAAKNLGLFDGTNISMLRQSNRPRANNTSGVRGVSWNKRKQKWSASIGLQGKDIYLGAYSKFEDAVAARKSAEEKYFAPIIEKYDTEQAKEEQEQSNQ